MSTRRHPRPKRAIVLQNDNSVFSPRLVHESDQASAILLRHVPQPGPDPRPGLAAEVIRSWIGNSLIQLEMFFKLLHELFLLIWTSKDELFKTVA